MVAPEKSFFRPSAGGIEGRHQPLCGTSFPTLPAPHRLLFHPKPTSSGTLSTYINKYSNSYIHNHVNLLSSHLHGPHGTDHPGHESSYRGQRQVSEIYHVFCRACLLAREATPPLWATGFWRGIILNGGISQACKPQPGKAQGVTPVGKALVVCPAAPWMEVPLPHRIPGLLWLPA